MFSADRSGDRGYRRRVSAPPPGPSPRATNSDLSRLALMSCSARWTHAILVTAYHLLARQTTYQDPGADYYDRRHAERIRGRAIQTLERQGFRVTLEPVA